MAKHPAGKVWQRVRMLILPPTLDEDEAPLPRNVVWSLVKPRGYNINWMRLHGALPCGCTRNPITHRMWLYAWDCEEHGRPALRRVMEERGVRDPSAWRFNEDRMPEDDAGPGMLWEFGSTGYDPRPHWHKVAQ